MKVLVNMARHGVSLLWAAALTTACGGGGDGSPEALRYPLSVDVQGVPLSGKAGALIQQQSLPSPGGTPSASWPAAAQAPRRREARP